MRLPEIKRFKRFKWNYLVLAFLIPFCGMLGIMLVGSYEPFGNYSMLYSDMYHQYYPFFVAFRKALLSGDSLLFNWNVGMGMDYLGLISYYLASPLNLLSVLVPESLTLEYFSLLMPIKLGLASMFFAIFLKNVFGKDDLSITLFGAFYGLCAWALGYQWNIMWLDTFALLPLVVLGMVKLLKERKLVLYTLTLFLSVLTNYYIGFFTCIFIFLAFCCYEICRFKSIGRFFADLGLMALFSILAIGMTAILELPALAALQNTQSSVNTFPESFWDLNIAATDDWKGLFEAMMQVAGNMGGSLEPTFKEGLPNLYCGVGTIAMAFLFLIAKDVKLRDKICSVVLLLFFMVSFIVRQLDYMWHGFHFTNMIPYRFSFLFSFVLLYMAYRAWLLRDTFKVWQFIVAGVLALALLLSPDSRGDLVYLSFNLAFLLLYVGMFIYARVEKLLADAAALADQQEDEDSKESPALPAVPAKQQISVIPLMFAGIMVLELALNGINFGIRFPYTNVINYPKGTNYTASMIDYMWEREKNTMFFRAEVTHTQTLNDGALNGYNGVSTFTSSANVRVTEFMKALGYGAKNTYNRYCFEEASPIANLFLNLKYMIEREGNAPDNAYFDTVHHYGNVYLLQNNAYLPLGFLAESALADLDVESNSNNFLYQNAMFRMATGINTPAWTLMSSNSLEVTASNSVTIGTQTSAGYTTYTTGSSSGTLRYTYNVTETGFLCFDITMPSRNSFRVYKNDSELYYETISLPQMLAVGDVVPGDVIEVEITCKSSQNTSINIRAGLLNEEVFRQGYDVLAASTLDLTTFSNTLVEGTIDCNRDGLMYTSIPYDGNWTAQVDGEPAEIVLIGNAMIGLNLTEGRHTVTFTYRNQAFNLGALISVTCAAVFVGIYAIVNRSSIRAFINKRKKK